MGGFDVKAAIEGIRSLGQSNWVALAVVLAALWLFVRSRFYKRLTAVLEDLFFTNWRLGLLAATGLVLSAASGWTTWDGMRNFTGEPILSAMVTFGIQGVMLIVAWLIGESFATGMNVRSARTGGTDHNLVWSAGFGFAGILALMLSAAAPYLFGSGDARVYLLGFGAVLIVVSLFIVAARTDTLGGYVDAMRVMVKSGVLWVMFLACMATSVFFSFDSLFSTIFPQSERARAAELRAQNQVAGVVADIGSLIQSRQLAEAENLFTQKGWADYDKNLTALAREAGASQGAIEAYFVQQMESRKQAIQSQQERIATAQASQAGLSQKQIALREELTRLESDRPTLQAAFVEKKGVVEEKQKNFDAKRVEAMAEERGVEGTGKVGQGPQFRARKAEEAKLQDEIKIAQERLRDAERPLRAAETRIASIKRELATIDGDIAKLKGEAQTAESRIKITQETNATDEGPKVDPARILPQFEKLRGEFRQSPKAEGLGQIQQMCLQMVGAMSAAPTTKEKVRGIDCDPKTASEAAARVFALNDGIKTFGANCAGGDKIAQYKSADALFEFARKCVQDSGLASKDTDALRQKINTIELNRDDKANRFVVTWNAFNDGNRLAYLALAIAIAIDSLVFMSGLFGANAVRSPLSDVPSSKARSAEQLEAIIDNALLPSRFENARIAIEAMHADTSRPGYSAIIDTADLDPERRAVVSKVLNAGATISAVHRDERHPSRYFVRPELFEYLSIAGNKAFEKHGDSIKEDIEGKLKLAQLEKDISVALLPEPGQSTGDLNRDIASGAQLILDHLHPFPYREGSKKYDDSFRTELRMDEFEAAHKKVARRAMTAGYGLDLVRPAVYKINGEEKEQDGRYVLHTDLVKTLTRLRARMLLSTSPVAQIAASPARHGGTLGTSTPQIGAETRHALGYDRKADERSAPAAPSNAQPSGPAVPPVAATSPFDEFRAGAMPPLAEDFATPPAQQTVAIPQPAANPALHRELVEHFAREMGQQESTIEYLLRHAGEIDVERLWTALDLVLQKDDAGLRRPLMKAMKSIERSIDDARAQVPPQLITQPGAVADLNDFADRLKSMTVVMVMLPGAAYDNIINQMDVELEADKGAGRLTTAMAEKHRVLVRHRSELAKAEYSEDHWDAILQSLMKFHAGLDQIAVDRPPTSMA